MSNGNGSIPPWKYEVDRVEHQCDERHRRSNASFGKVYDRMGKAEARQQQLFGDPTTRTQGVIGSLQTDVSYVKQKVVGIELKLAAIVAVLQALGFGAYFTFK